MRTKKITIAAALSMAITSTWAQTPHYTKTECGTEFSVVLRSDSTLWGWGQNYNGQLGTTAMASTNEPLQLVTAQKWIDVAAGSFHILAIAADSSLWGWGLNGNGQVGCGTVDTPGKAPVQLMPGTKWRSVSAGMVYSLAIKNDGTLWATGSNYYGQLGLGDTTDRLAWTQVDTATNWKQIAAGGVFSFAIKQDGSMWSWGFNGDGELGLGHVSLSHNSPQRVGTATDWAAVSCGFEYVMAVKTSGTLWSAGFNGNRSLGRTTAGAVDSVFGQVGSSTDWLQPFAGGSFAFIIKTDHSLWGCGYNGYGQLGLGTTLAAQPLTRIGTDSDWQYIAAADGAIFGSTVVGSHSAGFHTGGLQICTAGAGYIGQLADSTYWPGTYGQPDFYCEAAPLLGVEELTAVSVVHASLAPNPATDEVTISGIEDNTPYVVSDIAGRVVLTGFVQAKQPIQVVDLKAGFYTLTLNNKNGVSKTLKFIKQ